MNKDNLVQSKCVETVMLVHEIISEVHKDPELVYASKADTSKLVCSTCSCLLQVIKEALANKKA